MRGVRRGQRGKGDKEEVEKVRVRRGKGEGRGREVRQGEGKREKWRGRVENWAPFPKGFPQYNKLGSVRHVCEMQGVMTF